MDYERAMFLLKRCVESICNHYGMCDEVLEELHYSGFHDDEIKELGHGYLFDDNE